MVNTDRNENRWLHFHLKRINFIMETHNCSDINDLTVGTLLVWSIVQSGTIGE